MLPMMPTNPAIAFSMAVVMPLVALLALLVSTLSTMGMMG